jgi:osmotically-inducible protein OsmY
MVSTESEVELLVARVAELELRTTLLEAMRSDPALRGVVPEVVDGKVTLYGAISSELERQLAWEVARGLAADLAVEDRLRVLPGAEEAEGASAELVELVELALHSSSAFDSDSGRIQVVEWGGGGVALQGSVRSRAEQLLAERLAGAVTGIEGVVNELQIRAEAPPR